MTPERPQDTPATDTSALVHELAQAIRAVPGVVDLEPTLTGRVVRLGGQLLGRQLPTAGQGMEMRLDGSTAIVTVDVAVSTCRSAVVTAEQVQQAVCAVLAQHTMPCTSVTVSILRFHG